MKKTVLTAAVILSFGGAVFANHVPAGRYTIDNSHSKVGFEISHLVVSTVEGRFNVFSGNVVVEKDNLDILTEINMDSVDTGIDKRDEHLKSPDFFEAQKFPKMIFKSKKVTWKKDKFKLVGDLTLHGVTKEVTLNGQYKGSVVDQFGNDRVVADASAKINRKDFGLTWNKLVEKGPVVGDEVVLSFKIEAVREKK